jgi:hypothetical protein
MSVLSFVVHKRLSEKSEDVATDALAYILRKNEVARNGLLNLLRRVATDLPELRFQTQQTEEGIRPDLWGYDGPNPRVFIESKFWAGLTENQPVAYIKQLARQIQPSVLLMIVPSAREEVLWRDLIHRLGEVNITVENEIKTSDVRFVTTQIGPKLALISWAGLISALESGKTEDQEARSDLIQLRELCAADNKIFIPFSQEATTDLRNPTQILQLGTVLQDSLNQAVTENLIIPYHKNNFSQDWNRIGPYITIGSGKRNVPAWIGIDFNLWKKYGITPLWINFWCYTYSGVLGRGREAYALLEPWAVENPSRDVALFMDDEEGEMYVGIKVPTGEDKDKVVKCIIKQLKEIRYILSPLIDP